MYRDDLEIMHDQREKNVHFDIVLIQIFLAQSGQFMIWKLY